MKKHRFNIFPEMLPEDYQRLKNDIDTNDYDTRNPIWFYEGAILDGWNREKVCIELGIEPVYAEFIGTEMEAIEFVMRTNNRRDLTSSQRACIAVESEGIIESIRKQAKERQIRKPQSVGQLIAPQNPEENKTRTKVAELFNTNRTYFNEAQKLKNEKPEIFEDIKSGKKTIPEIKKEEKIEKRNKQLEIIRQKIETENIIIKGKYDVISIDPPWAYEERGGIDFKQHDPENRRGLTPYPTMKLDQIENIKLPIKNDAVVFLWTTHAFLKDAFDLIKKWGLNYKAVIVWDKGKMGLGMTIRLQCEFCLLAIKGKPLIKGNKERDIIRESRREHSRKPEAFYSMVERMTIGRRLDYFSREKRENWDVYGIETGRF